MWVYTYIQIYSSPLPSPDAKSKDFTSARTICYVCRFFFFPKAFLLTFKAPGVKPQDKN